MEGLVECSEAEFGLASAQPGRCPNASKIGTVMLQTPLLDGLPDKLKGQIYAAEAGTNPLGAPVALYLEAEGSGVLVKLAGQLTQNSATGQLTLTFEDFPQLPFSDVRLAFIGGQYALLASPSACGLFTATSYLAPWSAGPDATPSSSFQIDTGAEGGACPGPPSSPPSSSSAPESGSGPTSIVPNATVTLAGTRIATSRSGKASIELACAGTGVCRGKLTLAIRDGKSRGKGKSADRDKKVRSKTIVIGTAVFSIPAGKTAVVEIELDAAGRALLRADHGRLSATLTVLKSSPAPLQTHIESVRLVQRKTRQGKE
jgi:hypothetical protein